MSVSGTDADSSDGTVTPSYGQQRLWALERLEGASGAYNIPLAGRLRGRLDVRALGSALADIVRRHAPLRTLAWERDGELVWRSLSSADPRLALSPALRLAAGEGLRFQCDYVNATGVELRFGVGSADESCALNATYFTEYDALDGMGRDSEGCLLLDVDSDGVSRN